ncbi:MAG: winged helix-turn-helix transcriptional regulator [Clostridia bacterium]|nr:winged helix-turn-helix transcriptional regulator [Clostridia bacterium]
MDGRFETFTVLISKINRNIRKIKTEEVEEWNLKSPHVSCLYYLYKQNGMTAKQLCNVCDEDKAAISRSVEYLENNGYITCESRAQKRYKSPLCLTEKGETVGKAIAEKIDRILASASEGLTEENRQIFYQSLALISDNLQKICDEYENRPMEKQ